LSFAVLEMQVKTGPRTRLAADEQLLILAPGEMLWSVLSGKKVLMDNLVCVCMAVRGGRWIL